MKYLIHFFLLHPFFRFPQLHLYRRRKERKRCIQPVFLRYFKILGVNYYLLKNILSNKIKEFLKKR